jgi:hypothetical protein
MTDGNVANTKGPLEGRRHGPGAGALPSEDANMTGIHREFGSILGAL